MARLLRIFIPIIVGLFFTTIFLWENITIPAVYITPTVGTNDLTDALVPLRFVNQQLLQRRQLPLWLPQFSSGYPYYAWVMAIFYPINLISYFLPLMKGLNFVLFADLFLIFIFSYLYLRKIKIGIYGSLFSASLISFGGFSANELIRSDILVTFYLFIAQLWLLECFLQKQGKQLYLVLVMGILWGLSISAGHPQILFYSLLMLFPYWIFFWFYKAGYQSATGDAGYRLEPGKATYRTVHSKVEFANRKQMAKRFLLFFLHASICAVIGLGVGAGYILPMAEFTLNSDRASGLSVESVSRYNFPFEAIATLVRPFALFDPRHTVDAWTKNAWPTDERYVYIGIIGLAFGILGAIRARKYGAHAIFFLIVAIGALLFAFGTQLTVGNILTVPPFSFFRIPFKVIFLIDLSLGILAAFSFDGFYAWLRKRVVDSALAGKRVPVYQRVRQGIFRKAIVFGIIVILFVVSFFDLKIHAGKLHPPVDAKTWYETPEVVKFFKGKLHDQERVTTQFYYYPSIKIFLFNPKLWDDPKTFVHLRNLLPSFNNLLYGVPMNVGSANSAAIKIQRYNKLEQEIFFGGIRYADDLSAISVTDSFLFLNRIMGVKYAIFGWPVQNEILMKAKEVRFKNGQDPVYVYEFFDYYPRVFMVPRAQKASADEIKMHLVKGDFNPKDKVFVEERVGDWGAKGGYAATSLFDTYENTYISINTQSSGDGFLFLSDTYYPGWRAYVDGKETKIYLANYAFRAVKVPEGRHKVEFRFVPMSFYYGAGITVVTLGITAVWVYVLMLVGVAKRKR